MGLDVKKYAEQDLLIQNILLNKKSSTYIKNKKNLLMFFKNEH